MKKPPEHYPDWTRLVVAAWNEGMKNMNPSIVAVAAERIKSQLLINFNGEEEKPPIIRPSSGLTCPTQSYFIREGAERTPMPDTIQAAFAMGHFAHELAYAALKSGLPKGLEADVEIRVDTGFPDDCNQKGTADVVFHRTAEAEEGWLNPDEPDYILGDLKTMVGFAWRDHKKKSFHEQGIDAWGHLAQLAVYVNSPTLQEKYPGIEKNGALLIGVNKESPQMGLAPRRISPVVLADASKRVAKALETTSWPGPWLMDNFPEVETAFYCGTAGRKGYCPYSKACKSARATRAANV